MTQEETSIGIDLCQHVLNVTTNTSLKESFLPSALLPYYFGEEGIYGETALEHRRGRGYDWPPEARIDGGRVPLISCFAQLKKLDELDGINLSETTNGFSWKASKDLTKTKASEIIIGSAIGFSTQKAAVKVLITPDSYREFAQQELKKAIEKKSKHERLHFLPRSIALAIKWIDEYSTTPFLQKEPGFIGHIRVCSFGMDEWTLRTIPLKVIDYKKERFIVPVFDPLGHSSLGFWGLQLAFLSKFVDTPFLSSKELWQEIITGNYLETLLNDPIKNSHLSLSQIWDPSPQSIYQESVARLMSELPYFEDIPLDEMNSDNLKRRAISTWKEQKNDLPTGAESCLGSIIDGCFSNISLDSSTSLGHCLSKIEMDESSDQFFCLKYSGFSLASEGAKKYGEYLIKKLPTFEYTLIPMSIYCTANSEEGFEWKPLVTEKCTLEANQSHTLEPISGILFRKGTNKISFILERPHKTQKETSFIYRNITSSPLSKASECDLRVQLEVEIKPGNGFARIKILSEKKELLTTLDWSTMQECEKPSPPKIGYLPFRPIVTSKKEKWIPVRRLSNRLKGVEKVTGNLAIILGDLTKQLKKKEANQDQRNELFGAVSCQGRVPTDEEGLLDLQSLLDKFWEKKSVQQDKKLKNKLIEAAGWLYLQAPLSIKNNIIHLLKKAPGQVKREVLGFVAKVFHTEEDIQLFFTAFDTKMNEGIKASLNWLRALIHILQYREESLKEETVNNETLLQIVNHLIEILGDEHKKNNYKNIAMACVQALLSILYRRKYDKTFLSVGSKYYSILEDLFNKVRPHFPKGKQLHTSLEKESKVDIIQKALLFLQNEANEKDGNFDFPEAFEEEDDTASSE